MISSDELKRRKELFEQGYWEVPDNLDTSNFDFSWRPDPWDRPYIHQFGTQWQKTGGPRFVIPENEGVKYQTHQHSIRLRDDTSRAWRNLKPNVSFDYSWHPDDCDPPYIYVFGNQWYDSETMPTVQYRVKGATEKKYVTDIIATLDVCMDRWIVPDYVTDFDYSWEPNPHDPPYEHQFPTDWHCSTGPRYICENNKGLKYHKEPIAKTNITNIDQLVDTVEYTDSVIEVLKKHSFKKPFVYVKRKGSNMNLSDVFKNKESLVYVIGNSEAVVSVQAMSYLYDKIYDYPNIHYHTDEYTPELLDIVFFSNGETCAEENYQRLLDMNLPNRIVHVKGVQGRIASQYAAANSSNTEWYFLINAKLKVNKDFDFSWQPDVLKSRRHYIFKATNTVNGLEYGHMAIVANNKTLTLNTQGRGLDFTLDSPTENVDINSGTAVYNSSEWDTWRTSFREVIKLCHAKDSDSKKRLEIWTSVAEGDFAQHSLQGAKDAVEYYESVNGDFEKLKLSYDWDWLREKFNK